jgi:ribosome-binding protein aMBF1 (putative translation factor)
MSGLYAVEVEPEVRSWLAGLSDRDFGRADFLVGLLAEQAETLGEPYARHLGGKVRELRFHLLTQQTRVTYWLAPGRRVILLTVSARHAAPRPPRSAALCKPRRSARPSTGQHTSRSTGRCPDMTAGHSSYDDLARDRRDSAEYREGYAEAQRAFLIGQAVRERRLALGLSQTELAARAGMTQPALSRLEAGGVIPTIPLLDRISGALDADLIVQISPHAA